ncbi:hypothetical protein MAR_030995 [Mya arenaria]|uniref:Uncharacterized protein n=1 Tax=Mya arenaria TaxID=6604 RepID=A0ABY7F6F7_MYAAR|nr:hypothetical protein MAR_030995 [Mya arenaria]
MSRSTSNGNACEMGRRSESAKASFVWTSAGTNFFSTAFDVQARTREFARNWGQNILEKGIVAQNSKKEQGLFTMNFVPTLRNMCQLLSTTMRMEGYS